MNPKKLAVWLLLSALLVCAFAAQAERSAPKIVGANAYKKQPGEVEIQPFTYTEATIYLAKLAKSHSFGAIIDSFGLESFTWSRETVGENQTLMELTGKNCSVTLVLEGRPFGETLYGTGNTADLYPLTRERGIAEFRFLEWTQKDLPAAIRDVNVGGTLETLLSAFGVTEISAEGLIYDNDLLYAEEGSEDSDYQYHPEQHAIIYEEGNQVVLEFTAYEAHSSACYVLTYRFQGEKIVKITMEAK